jgi:hypothetical protein
MSSLKDLKRLKQANIVMDWLLEFMCGKDASPYISDFRDWVVKKGEGKDE